MNWKEDLKIAVRVLFGAANALPAGYLLFVEVMQSDTHTAHVGIFAAWMAIGMGMMWPSLFFGTVKQVVVIVKDFAPDIRFGGRRRDDPPKSDAP